MEIGIDIGTSYSSVAVLGVSGVIPVKSDTGQCAYGNSYSIPTAVFAKKDGKLLIGQAAVASRMIAPSCFKDGFKRDFGSDTPFLLGDFEFTIDQFYIEFIRHFKQEAEKLTGKPVSKAYLTHPANYTESKKQRLRTAATYAGLSDIQLVAEPTAAALSYLESNTLKTGNTLLVYDFGGGTFDLALVKATSDGFEQMTEPLGIEHCGGLDFDMMIYDDIINTLSADYDISSALGNMKFLALLYEESIKVKHRLSFDDTADATIPFGIGEFLTYSITRQKYNQMISGQVLQTCDLIKKIAKNAGIPISDIDFTLCVGGTTRTPFILEQLERTIDKPVCRNADPELAICCGAAAYSKSSILADIITEAKVEIQQPINEALEAERKNEHESGRPIDLHETTSHGIATIDRPFHLPEKRGNTIGNTANGGYYAFTDDWVFTTYKGALCKIDAKYNHGPTGLVTALFGQIYIPSLKEGNSIIKNEHTYIIKLLECVPPSKLFSDINVLDEWIYCRQNTNIYKININTNQHSILTDDSKSCCVINDWIYYHNNTSLYRMTLDGTQKIKITDTNCLSFCVSDDWIYYVNRQLKGANSLCRIRRDGTQQAVLYSCRCDNLHVLGDTIYFYDRGWINKMCTDGTDRKYVGKSPYCESILLDNGWIYYLNKNNIHRMQMDGGNPKRLTENSNSFPCKYFGVCGDWIYYHVGRNDLLKRVRLDGNEDGYI